jgi:N utilization substance protein B
VKGSLVASSRRRARELALQVLYAIDLGSGGARRRDEDPQAPAQADRRAAAGPDETFDAVAANFEMPEGARDFARELVQQVHGHLEELDASIGHHSANWRVERMAAVDRNILRLGTYELAHTATPAPVILNEAVDLARRFSHEPSPSFVNGILDAVAHGVREWES